MGLDMYLHAERPSSFELKVKTRFGGGNYLAGYEFADQAEQDEYRRLVAETEAGDLVDPETPSATIEKGVASLVCGYWRKANAIHGWFVANVQGGEDECNPFPVSRQQLEELRGLCQTVLRASKTEAGKVNVGWSMRKDENGEVVREDHLEDGAVVTNPAVAQEVLPAQSGFFFGGTDYDEYYLRDLKDTIEIVDRALKAAPEWNFVYRSSW